MPVVKRKKRCSSPVDRPPDQVDPGPASVPSEAPAEQAQPAAQTAPADTNAAGSPIADATAGHETHFDDALRELEGRIAGTVQAQIAAFTAEMKDLISTAAVRQIHRPIIDQLILLGDRLRSERAFLDKRCREEKDVAGHSGGDRPHQSYDAAIASFIDEIEAILQRLDVVPISVLPGAFNCRHQQVVGVEPTDDPQLDGQVKAIVRPGYLWASTVLRPEQVRVFRKER